MTELALAQALGVSARTIRNAKKSGFRLELTDDGGINVDLSIHAYVRFQSNQIRELKAQKGRGNSGNSKDPDYGSDGGIDWKVEKDKQAAIKGRLANEQAMGNLVPAEAMIELYNAPLSLCRSKLLGLSSEIQKRVELDPATVKEIDDIVRDALARLGEKSVDELQKVIQEIIERYSEYYSAADEDGDHSVDD